MIIYLVKNIIHNYIAI